MTVSSILKQKGSTETLTISGDAPLSEAVRLLAEKRVGALVVSPDGASIDGILSERDVIRVLGERGRAALDRPVASAMTREVETCAPDEHSDRLLARMTEGRFRHLPVLRDGRLAGVVSIGDVVKYRISEIEMEKHALEDMIRGL